MNRVDDFRKLALSIRINKRWEHPFFLKGLTISEVQSRIEELEKEQRDSPMKIGSVLLNNQFLQSELDFARADRKEKVGQVSKLQGKIRELEDKLMKSSPVPPVCVVMEAEAYDAMKFRIQELEAEVREWSEVNRKVLLAKEMYKKALFCHAYGGTSSMHELKTDLEKVQGWIPVSERLPEQMADKDYSEEVLVICWKNDQYFAWYDFVMEKWKTGHGALWEHITPTHWQPLSPPPTGETK